VICNQGLIYTQRQLNFFEANNCFNFGLLMGYSNQDKKLLHMRKRLLLLPILFDFITSFGQNIDRRTGENEGHI